VSVGGLLVKQADSVCALIMFAPRLVIVACSIAEGTENTFKIPATNIISGGWLTLPKRSHLQGKLSNIS
jgi:hypothetical protein